MRKSDLFGIALICFVGAVVFFVVNIPLCGGIMLLVAAVPGIAFVQSVRKDHLQVAENRAVIEAGPAPQVESPVERTSPGSHGLFVPDSLEHR